MSKSGQLAGLTTGLSALDAGQLQHCVQTPYDNCFFDQITDESLASARIVVPLLLELVQPESVIDVGCGRGGWLRAFQEHGVERLQGFDGFYVERSKLLIDEGSFTPVDISKPFTVGRSYDLALCLEVAEHLPRHAARGLVRSLAEAAPLVLFSAAVPGQGGTNHINEQWPSYWRALFAERGYRRLDPVRPRIWRNRYVASYYSQNLYLFASPEAIAKSAKLQEEERIANDVVLELIDGRILARYRTLRGILRECPRVMWRAIIRRLVPRAY
jgi:SAM-dependent methyltransferase